MKYYVTASAYSVMGQVHAQVSARELVPEGDCHELFTAACTLPDNGTDDPRKYAIQALMYLAESI